MGVRMHAGLGQANCGVSQLSATLLTRASLHAHRTLHSALCALHAARCTLRPRVGCTVPVSPLSREASPPDGPSPRCALAPRLSACRSHQTLDCLRHSLVNSRRTYRAGPPTSSLESTPHLLLTFASHTNTYSPIHPFTHTHPLPRAHTYLHPSFPPAGSSALGFTSRPPSSMGSTSR